MAKRIAYRPGTRNPKYRGDGRMSENRLAWIRTIIGQAVIMLYKPSDDDDDDEIEYGPTVRLVLPRPGGRPLISNITALTMDELEVTREFYNLLFDLAEPVIRERDRIAKDAYDNGDDSYPRSYRPVPQFIVRRGAVGGNGESLHERLASLLEGAGDRRGFPGGVRADSEELAERDEEEGGPQDYGSSDHEH